MKTYEGNETMRRNNNLMSDARTNRNFYIVYCINLIYSM